MIEGIALAAGSSSRAGMFKMELPLGGKTLIEYTVSGMLRVCENVIVVGGHRAERIRELLSQYSKVEVVENPDWKCGMFGSVKAGVRRVKGSSIFLLPADIPLVSEPVYRALLMSPGRIAIPVCRGRKGHPILISSVVIPEILNEPDDSNMRNVVRRVGFEPVEVDDESIALDVDTQEDYGALKKKLGSAPGA